MSLRSNLKNAQGINPELFGRMWSSFWHLDSYIWKGANILNSKHVESIHSNTPKL